MDRHKFKKLILLEEKCSERSSKLFKLGVHLWDYDDNFYAIISELWSEILTKEGVDWADWFKYEKDFGKRLDFKAWDADKNEICKDLDDLYDYLVENKYFKL